MEEYSSRIEVFFIAFADRCEPKCERNVCMDMCMYVCTDVNRNVREMYVWICEFMCVCVCVCVSCVCVYGRSIDIIEVIFIAFADRC